MSGEICCGAPVCVDLGGWGAYIGVQHESGIKEEEC